MEKLYHFGNDKKIRCSKQMIRFAENNFLKTNNLKDQAFIYKILDYEP